MTIDSKLIERIEGAREGSRELDALIWCVLNGKKYQGHNPAYAVYERDNPRTQVEYTEPPKRTRLVTGDRGLNKHALPYTSSIDAAMTLVPEGAHCGMGYDSPREGETVGRAWAWVRCKVNGRWEETPIDWRGHRPPSIALALVAAALRSRSSS